ncbi:LuxR family transcriptional regulator [Kutzneria viridogrisea]
MLTLRVVEPTAGASSLRNTPPPLIGRQDELSALLDVLACPPAVVLVEGEAGIGKTRLVSELLAHPALSARRVLSGGCQPMREPFPYGPVFDALAALHPPPRLGLNPVVGALRGLLPEIAHHLPPVPPALGDPLAERHQLFRAVRELLASCGPTVLVIDDLHWADEATLQLLRFLLCRIPEQLSLVLAYRPEELPWRVPLGSLPRRGWAIGTTVVRLGALDQEQVHVMASRTLGTPVGTEFARRLVELTAGIPFVLEEVLRAVGDGELDSLDGLDVPVPLRAAVADRLAVLPGTAVRVAKSVAVLDAPSEARLIGEVAAIRGDRLSIALQRLLAAGVLRENPPGHYGFRHSLARQAVYEVINGPERQLLHGRTMRALSRVRPAPLVRLAEHAKLAGHYQEWLDYAESAADHAESVGDTAVAIEVLQRVLDGGALDTADVERLAVKLSRVALRGLHRAVTTTLRAILVDPRLSRPARGRIRLNLGLLLIRWSGTLQEGRAEVERAIKDLAGEPEHAAHGISVLAQPLEGELPLSWHLPWMERARRLADLVEDPEKRLALRTDRIATLVQLGDEEGWRLFERLTSVAATTAEQVQLSRLWCNVADGASWCGYHERAAALLEQGLRMAGDCGALFVAGTARSTQLRLDWLTGNWSGLSELCRRLLDSYQDVGPVAAELSLVMGSLAAARGEWEVAEQHLLATGVPSLADVAAPVVLSASGTLVRMRLSAEDVVEACAEADRGLAAARRKGVWVWACELVPVAVEAYVRGGRLESAEQVLADFELGVAGRQAPLAQAALAAGQGLLLAAHGDRQSAVERLGEASAAYAALPMPYAAAWVLECSATSAEDQIEVLSSVADTYDQLGATRDAARCRHLLRMWGSGKPSRRGRRGYGDQLSPRERDVARLLATGQTNKEIADVLFLSPRTVEQHVARVLHKLNLRSRSEVRAEVLS